MYKKLPLGIVAMLCLNLSARAQTDWRELMHDPDANFFEVQQLFYDEFGDQVGEKGSGWKQFKRWEYYHQNRIDENGNIPTADERFQAIQEYEMLHPEAKSYVTGTGNWTELGPISLPQNGTGQPNGLGRLSCIAFHPTNANTLFVGAAAGGFWKSTDNGATWAKSISGMTRLGVNSIVVHPTTPNTIFIGTGDRDGGNVAGYGVWKSTDGGATWSASNTGMGNRTVYEILMDPTNPNRLIASTNGSRIYRSLDGGATWTFSSTSSAAKDIAFKPGDPNTIYAAGSTFDVSTDGGVTFVQTTSGVPAASRFAIAVSAAQPSYVYIVGGNGSGLVGVYRSTNSGTSFSTRTTTPNILGYSSTGSDASSQAWYDLVMVANPANADEIYVGGINIWKSTDGGSNFSISAHWVGTGADDVHADQHVLEYSPHNSHLYNGNDGGIYYTTDAGTNWTDISSGLAIAQIYKIGVAQSTEGYIINGYQDNGTGIYYNGTWRTEIGGDGMECIIDPTDQNYMYGALYYGNIRRSTNAGANFSQISTPVTETGGWVTPYKLDPNNPGTMYAGYDNIWRSTDVKTGSPPTWTSISSFSGTQNIVDLAIAPSNSDVMYVSRSLSSERFFRTTNASAGSPSWTNLTGFLPTGSTPKDIEIDPTDPTHLFIALGNDIYESTNSGASWTNYSGTLPNISLNTIVIDPNSTVDAMYVGMDVGIYYRDNTMADWSAYSTGIPNIEVTELEIYNRPTECRSKLYAATYGQGLWVSDLKDPGNRAPTACFKTLSTTVCTASTVVFTDESDYAPVSWSWSITPGTFTYVSGTNASSQNPKVQFNAAGTYTVALTATNAHGNDIESKANFITVSASTVATSFNDDFESYGLCGTASDCGATVCALGGNWTNLTNGSADNIDWRVDENGTPTGGSGPSVDYNPGSAAGNYAYLEASSCFGQTAILESGCIQLNVNYTFDMAYHMSGADMGSLHVDIFANGAWTQDVTAAISGDQGAAWQTMSIDLSAYTGQSVRMRVRGITGSSFNSDIAIDDIQFNPISNLPVELVEFDAELTEGDRVRLNWETASELNSDYFVVQRSEHGTDWEDVAEEDAMGNSQQTAFYETWDYQPYGGISYYRLKSVDLDGSVAYSNVKSISRNVEESIVLYPNPAEDYILVKGDRLENGNVAIMNALGQRLLVEQTIDSGEARRFEIAQLPAGVYLVVVEYPNGDRETKRFSVK